MKCPTCNYCESNANYCKKCGSKMEIELNKSDNIVFYSGYDNRLKDGEVYDYNGHIRKDPEFFQREERERDELRESFRDRR